MNEDAGNIYSEVRIRLDKLQADITQAVNKLDNFGASVVDMGNTASNLFTNSYSKSIANVKTYLASLDDAVKAGAITQKQAIEQSIAVRKQELAYIQATAAKKGGYTTQEINDIKATQAALNRLEAEYKQVAGESDNAGKSATGFSAASVAAAAVVAVAFRSLVTATSDYSAALAGVQAATRASAEEMALLTKAADETAQQYGKTNTEALQGIEALSKAGVSTADIIGGGLAGALALAASGEMSVADAAEAAAGIMTQFGKTGADVTHIADLLSAAAGNAIGEVSDFTQAFKQVGLVANSTGLSLEDTTAVLAQFAAGSLLGSDAGTSFKTFLQRLNPVSDEARALMEKLGFSAFDAKGQFVGISSVAEQLKTKLGGMSDAQKQATLTTLFGSDATRAAIELMKGGADGIAKWTELTNQQGFAAETARIKMDSLAGDMEKLNAATTNATASLGQAATPALRGLTQIATGVLSAINALPGPVKAAIVTIGGLTGAIIAFAAAGPGVISVIKGIGIAAATSLGPFGLIASAVGVLAVGLGAAAVSAGVFEDSTTRMVKNNRELINATKAANEEFANIVGPVNEATRSNKLSADQIDKLKKLYPELTNTMNLNKATIEEVTEAQKKLNAARNNEIIANINKQIDENNKLIEKATKTTNQTRSAQDQNTQALINQDKALVANYEKIKTHTKAETEAYEMAVKRLSKLNEQGKFEESNLLTSERTTQKLKDQNKALLAQIRELDGTADAARKAQAVRDEAAAREKANEEARKQAIEQEKASRINSANDYAKTLAVFKQLRADDLISEEEYQKKIISLANDRINQIQSQAVKDGALSQAAKKQIVDEIAVRDEAQKKLDILTASKKSAADREKDMQAALSKTIEAMIAERDELAKTGVMTKEQAARYDELSKKIAKAQEDERETVEKNQSAIRKAQELTANFRAAYTDGLIDSIDREAGKKKAALSKEIADLRAANDLMLASNKEYADQSAQITQYAADQSAKIEAESFNARIGQVSDFVGKVGQVFNGLLSALGSLYEAMNQAQLDSLDTQYQQNLDALDADTQAQLEAAGLAEQTDLEKAQAKLDAAIAANDAEAISEAEKELKKQQILKDAADKKIAIDKKYEKEKAQLQYKASLEAWNLQLLNAIAGTAVAVVNALQTQPIWLGIVMAALAGVTGGIQIAAVAAAKPKPPALATGGIAIPGADGKGAQVLMAENGSPELALNGGASGEPFLNNFADKIAQRIGVINTSKDITLILQIDSSVLSKVVAKDINNGVVKISL